LFLALSILRRSILLHRVTQGGSEAATALTAR